MKIVTGEEMRQIDRKTTEQFGFPSIVLMENAGKCMADWLLEHTGKEAAFLILCGSGNNGGDGLVAARHLLLVGQQVYVWTTAPPEELSNDSRINFDILRRMGAPVRVLRNTDNPKELLPAGCTHIVDALLGTGISGAVRGYKKELITWINSSSRTIISLDIPSGLTCGGSLSPGPVVQADHTLTVELPKKGMLRPKIGGKITILKTGFPEQVLASDEFKEEWMESSLAAGLLPAREDSSHKGTNGVVTIIAGSRQYFGAAVLTALGAQAGGAGLIRLIYPDSAAVSPATVRPWLIAIPAEDEGCGFFTPASLEAVLHNLSPAGSCVIGPGLGRAPLTAVFFEQILPELATTVFDADGLFLLASQLKKGNCPLPDSAILTPHPGELKRLLNAQDCTTTTELAAALQTTITAKDWRTSIHAPDGKSRLITGGSPILATGGSGDILAGLTGALLARGLHPFDAASLAAFLHASAGYSIALKRGKEGLNPEELAREIPLQPRELAATPPCAPGAGRTSLIYPPSRRSS